MLTATDIEVFNVVVTIFIMIVREVLVIQSLHVYNCHKVSISETFIQVGLVKVVPIHPRSSYRMAMSHIRGLNAAIRSPHPRYFMSRTELISSVALVALLGDILMDPM